MNQIRAVVTNRPEPNKNVPVTKEYLHTVADTSPPRLRQFLPTKRRHQAIKLKVAKLDMDHIQASASRLKSLDRLIKLKVNL